jgi:hypothetical protein
VQTGYEGTRELEREGKGMNRETVWRAGAEAEGGVKSVVNREKGWLKR